MEVDPAVHDLCLSFSPRTSRPILRIATGCRIVADIVEGGILYRAFLYVRSFRSGENHDTGVRGRRVTELKVDKLAPQCSYLFGETEHDASPYQVTPSLISLERPCQDRRIRKPKNLRNVLIIRSDRTTIRA